MTHSITAVFLLTALAGAPAAAQTTSDRIADSVRPGLKVSIVDDRGRKIEGRVASLSEEAIRMSIGKRAEAVPFDRILRIERPDTVKNGAIVGFVVGLALGTVGGWLDHQGRGQRGSFMAVSAFGNGVVCAGLGALIDGAADNRRMLYERAASPQVRIAPVVGNDVRAVALAVSWK